MSSPHPLDSTTLLPPLLACLPTAFDSPKPPPALLPLLSPVLSQRVQLLSSSSTEHSTWLPLLNWDTTEASQLAHIIEDAGLEPHPISGEIETGEPEPTKYRRLDEETLQALVNLPDTGLAIVYLWSTAEGKQAWRVAEVKPIHAGWTRNPTPWETSIASADDAFESKTHAPAVATTAQQEQGSGGTGEQDDDDDDYWGRYDATPSRTPAKQSPAPASAYGMSKAANAEDSYWGQYASVQPALDSEDPDEWAAVGTQLGESGLDGNALLKAALAAQSQPQSEHTPGAPPEYTPYQQRSLFTPNGSKSTDEVQAQEGAPQRSLFTPNGTSTAATNGFTVFPPTAPATRHSPTASYEHIEHPRPQSSSSSALSAGSRSSRLVEQLEEQAERASSRGSGGSHTAADFAIQQHISTSMKSLYRLSKGAGIERREFERIIKAELKVLGMMDDE